MDGTREDLVDMFIVHTVEEIQGLIDAHGQFKATLSDADKEYNSIIGLVKDVESTVQKYQIPGGLQNPYTTLTSSVCIIFVMVIIFYTTFMYFCIQDLSKKWSEVKHLVPQRDTTLQAELRKQQSNCYNVLLQCMYV